MVGIEEEAVAVVVEGAAWGAAREKHRREESATMVEVSCMAASEAFGCADEQMRQRCCEKYSVYCVGDCILSFLIDTVL